MLAALGGARVAAAAAAGPKVAICHQTGPAAQPWVVISVAHPALAAHLARGGSLYGDCYADTDCAAGSTCVVATCQASSPACERGQMACTADITSILTCDCESSTWVSRFCAPGTICHATPTGDAFCDWLSV